MLGDDIERHHNSSELSDCLTTMHLVLLKEEIRNKITPSKLYKTTLEDNYIKFS